MDLRTHGKDFERFFDRAKARGVSFQRCRIHAVEPGDSEDDINLRFIAENGKQTNENFDLVVLSVGMEPPFEAAVLAKRTGIELTPEGFAATSCFSPVSTSQARNLRMRRFCGADGYSSFGRRGLSRSHSGSHPALGRTIQHVQAEVVSAGAKCIRRGASDRRFCVQLRVKHC